MRGTILGLRGLGRFSAGRSRLLGAWLVALLASGTTAGAAVLVADNFDNVASGAGLSGRTPTTSFNGATWVAPTASFTGNGAGGLNADMHFARTAAVDLGANYLVDNPGVYDLKLDITQPTSNPTATSWVAVGFAQGSTDGTVNISQQLVDNKGAPWVLLRLNGQEVVFGGPANTNQRLATATGLFADGLAHTFELRLDTATANWTLDAFVDGAAQDLNGATAGTTYTYVTNPTASRYLAMSTTLNDAGAIGTVDNFSLTGPVAVPEPGMAGLVVAGVGLLAGRRRRK